MVHASQENSASGKYIGTVPVCQFFNGSEAPPAGIEAPPAGIEAPGLESRHSGLLPAPKILFSKAGFQSIIFWFWRVHCAALASAKAPFVIHMVVVSIRRKIMADRKVVAGAIRTLEEVGAKARVFVSMPVIKGVTPRAFVDSHAAEKAATKEPVTRLHGIFALDEVGLSFLDHSALYGDACFEGILIRNGIVFLYREHLDRFWDSAAGLKIEIPYSKEALAWHVINTIQAVGFDKKESGYIRLIVTRGIGDLGLNPKKCVGATVYAVVSTIKLYPKEAYDVGIEVGVSKRIRRPGATILDPRIKSNNYLNNVLGLIEGTRNLELLESLMLTADGSIAEATVDNVFCVVKESGYRTQPSKVKLLTPIGAYCLKGITRACILDFARKLGYKVEEVADLMPVDLLGDDRECFMTGTGAGIMPIVKVCGNLVGDGRPGEITRKLLAQIQKAMANPAFGVSTSADRGQVARYMKSKRSPIKL